MKTEHIATANLKATLHRGSIRIWLEGMKLANAGFNRYDKFSHEMVDGDLVIKLDPEGPNAVSGRERGGKSLPIIDMHCAACVKGFTGGRLDVIYGVDGELGVIQISDAKVVK